MSLYTYFRELVRRNRRRVIVGLLLAAGTYVVTGFIQRKVAQIQDRLKEENATRELIKKRFNQTQRDCAMTFESFVPMLAETVSTRLDVDGVVMGLRMSKSIKSSSSEELGRSKQDLWRDLKSMSLARLFTMSYVEGLLVILIHLQLNIISRKSYMRTAMRVASRVEGVELMDAEEDQGDISEQAFLSLTWWILNRGWPRVQTIVERHVEATFGDVSLRDDLSLDEFSELLAQVQRGVDHDLFDHDQEQLFSALLPGTQEDLNVLLSASNSQEFLQVFYADAPSTSTDASGVPTTELTNAQTLTTLQTELTSYLRTTDRLLTTLVSLCVSHILQCTHETLETRAQAAPAPSTPKLALILTTMASKLPELDSSPMLHAKLNGVDLLDDLCASVYSNF